MFKPDVFSGTLAAPTDFTPSGPASQFAIQNRDFNFVFTLKVNDSNEWTLWPGEKLGIRMKNVIQKITLTPVTGTPNYQLFIN